MKKLIVTVVGLLGMVLLIGGCGADVDVEDCLDGFFEDYYSECINFCNLCTIHKQACNEDFDTDECILGSWNQGFNNNHCLLLIDRINKQLDVCTPNTDYCNY